MDKPHRSFFEELKRRKVVRVALVYLAVGYALVQGADLILPRLGLPDWTVTLLLWVLIAGFPLALLLSWIFDIGPEGLERTGAGEAAPRTAPFSMPDISLPYRDAYVGREAELGELQTLLERAVAGQGGLVMIGGEPGVGKSRLAEEALARGHALGMLPLTGHAWEERGAPFAPTIEILQELTRLLDLPVLRGVLGEAAPELTRLMPEWRSLFPDLPEPIELPPEQQQRRLFNAIGTLMERLSREVPQAILLDDLHWADESSMLLLKHLTPRLATTPVLILCTYRDVETEQTESFSSTLAFLARGDMVRRISLKQLGIEEVVNLLTALAGSAPPEAWAESIYRETEGNPFFVREVFAHLRESHDLVDAAGAWKPEVDVESIDVPEGVRLVIRKRLGRLRDSTRAVLLKAAALGLRFRVSDLEAVCDAEDMAGTSVIDELEEAVAAQLALAAPAQRDPVYEFSHALVRHTLLDSLSPPRRQQLHASIASALDTHLGSGADSRAALLAHHFFEAGAQVDSARARHFLRVAGDQAFSTAAYDEAVDWYERALSLDEGMEAAERGELLFHSGMALRGAQRWDEAESIWSEALPLLEATGDAASVAAICRELGYSYTWTGRFEEAAAVAEQGLAGVGPEPSIDRARLLAMAGHGRSLAGDLELAATLVREAVELGESLDNPRVFGGEILLSNIYRCEHSMRAAEHAATGKRAIAMLREHGTPWELSSVMGATLFGLVSTGDFESAAKYIPEASGLAVAEGNLGASVHCTANAAIAALAGGDLENSMKQARACIEVCRKGGFPWVVYGYALLGIALMYAGDFSGALHNAELTERDQIQRGAHLGGEVAYA